MADGPFCEIINSPSHPRIESLNEHAIVIRDGFPVTQGHTLIIPKRHVGSFFDITAHKRVINTMRSWDILVNEAFLMGGVDKSTVLKVMKPHMFFDNQVRHSESHRVCRRLIILRELANEQENNIFPRST